MAIGGPLSPLPPLLRQWVSSRIETVETGRRKEKEKERRKGKERERRNGHWRAVEPTGIVAEVVGVISDQNNRDGEREKEREEREREGEGRKRRGRNSLRRTIEPIAATVEVVGFRLIETGFVSFFYFCFIVRSSQGPSQLHFFGIFNEAGKCIANFIRYAEKNETRLLPMFRSADSGSYHRRRVFGGLWRASVGSIFVSPPSHLSLSLSLSFTYLPSPFPLVAGPSTGAAALQWPRSAPGSYWRPPEQGFRSWQDVLRDIGTRYDSMCRDRTSCQCLSVLIGISWDIL